jgi:hypothetical protein
MTLTMLLRWLPLLLLLPVMLASLWWTNYSRIAVFYPISLLAGWFLVRIWNEKHAWHQTLYTFVRQPRYYYPAILGFTLFFSLFGSLVRGSFPLPSYHDEFAYLLGADTFVHGRLANATPAGSVHFESYHINVQPAYSSKYQPGMGLVLALGQLLGHPYLGVLITLLVGSCTWAWMCRLWFTLPWAYLGSLLGAMMLITISSDCYFIGGALGTIPASLLLGILRIPLTQQRWWNGSLIGLSLVLFFWTRPFEGGLVTVLLGLWYLAKVWQEVSWLRLFSVIVPGSLLVLILAGLFQLQFNHACTSKYTKLPYLEHEDQYGGTPLFLIQHDIIRSDTFHYQHDEFRRFHQRMKRWHTDQRQTFLFTGIYRYKFETIWLYSLGLLWPLLLIALNTLWGYRRCRPLLITVILSMACHILLTTWVLPHYMGPYLPAWGILLTFALILCWKDASPLIRQLALVLLAACAVQFFYERSIEAFGKKMPWMEQRQQLRQQLEQQPGQHLVLVKYGAEHDVGEEWVYNGADLAGQRVLWARSMGNEKDRELMRQYPNRTYWLLKVTGEKVELVLYQAK